MFSQPTQSEQSEARQPVSPEIRFLDDCMKCDDPEVAFSYKAINKVERNYPMYCGDKFEGFYKPSYPEFTYLRYLIKGNENNSLIAHGWKFHISLANENDNIEKGWNIIKKHLINHKVYESKVIRDESRNEISNNKNKCGKEVTIYAFREKRSASDWEKVLQDITGELSQANIIPGPLPPDYRLLSLTGSNYISYLNDKKNHVYNPKEDPFISIEVKVEHQPERQSSANNTVSSNTDEKIDKDLDATLVDELSIEIETNQPIEKSKKTPKNLQRSRFYDNKTPQQESISSDAKFCCFRRCVIQ